MSVRERNRYITTAVVFLVAFVVLGLLFLRSVRSMAQDFTWRPTVSFVNVDSAGSASTVYAALARDNNLNTAAKTYVNANFTGDAPPASVFTWSARWAAFEQTARNIENVKIYVKRSTTGSSSDLWRYEYTTGDVVTGPWFLIDSGGQGAATATYSAAITSDTGVLDTQLIARVTTKQQDTNDLFLNTFDVRVEAERDVDAGGVCELKIYTPSTLPIAIVDEAYAEIIDAICGLTSYTWTEDTSLPSWLSGATSGGDPDYEVSGTPTDADIGTHTFTLTVEDSSTIQQDYTRQFFVTVAGLAINPPGPDLPDLTKGELGYSQSFTPRGVEGNASWCLLSGFLPPNMSLLNSAETQYVPRCSTGSITDNTGLSLTGTPVVSGTYPFKIRLKDTGTEETAIHNYLLNILPSGLTIKEQTLKPMIKGIKYSNTDTSPAYHNMTAQSLTAIRAIYSTYSSNITWTATGLPLSLSLADRTLDALADMSKVYITGTIDIDEPSRDYTFEATINDNSQDSVSKNFVLPVLGRKTQLLKAPPSVVKLPSDGKLSFVVTGEGGVPSNKGADTQMDGTSVPYYNYYWEATPVAGTNSPPLATPSDTTTPWKAGAETITITFRVGTYDVMIQGQDYLTRNPPDASDYSFVPVTTRIKVIPATGQALGDDIGKPVKSRQEVVR